MSRKRKRKKKKRKQEFDPATQARRLARALLGTAPGERVLPSRKKKEERKHKKRDLERALED